MLIRKVAALRNGFQNVWARRAVALVALLGFGIGVFYSARQIETVLFWPLLIVFGFVVPATIALSAIGLVQMAGLAGRRMPFADAFAATVYGRAAELTPLPGGVIANTAALMKSGANARSTAEVMSVSAILILAMSGIGAAFAIELLSLGIFSVLLFLAAAAWIAKKVGFRRMLEIAAIRFANVVLVSLRFYLGFLAVGYMLDPLATVAFSSNGILTSIIGIAPAGLGIAEGLASGVAVVVGVSPAVAFMATTCNRVVGMAAVGILFAIVSWGRTEAEKPES